MRLKVFIPFVIAMLVAILISTQGIAQPQRDDYLFYETDYRWLEIEDIGDELNDFRDNEVQGPFEIGYEFPYFGEIYEQFWVSSNGFIGFGPPLNYMSMDNHNLPDESLPNNIISLFWKDLNPEAFWADGIVYIGVREDQRIIEFQGIGEHNPDGAAPENTITMQIVLGVDGDITLQYKEIGEDFDLEIGTIGLEGPEGQHGTTILFNNDGVEVGNETAFLLSDHGPGDFLVWDAGVTPSGQIQVDALEALGHTVVYRDREDALPNADVLAQYEGVFINLGNHGANGRDYHVLSEAEGRILAEYLEAGNAVYLEGSDTWRRDDPTDAHRFFHIEGLADGGPLEPPVVGFDGTFGEGFLFEDYEANNNNFVDHIAPADGSQAIFSFLDDEEEYNGMVGLMSPLYRTIGCSFEFGALVDGDSGNKQELMERIVEFFRAPPPDFPPPLNLRATVGDGEVTLNWDHPRRVEGLMNMEIIDLQHQIAGLFPRNGEKPDDDVRELIVEMRAELKRLIEIDDAPPQRDELEGFTIYVGGEEYDFTNAHEYVIFDLENNREYEFSVSALYVDPEGESEVAGPIIAVPTEFISPDYNQGFEDFNGALTPTPGNNGWQWGEPEIGANGGERAWGTLLDRVYPDNATFYLQLPLINLSEVEACQLSWFHTIDAENGWDGGQVQISADGGERWELLIPDGGYPAQDIFSLNATPGFTGFFDWQSVMFDLTEWAGVTVLVRLLFASDESNFRAYNGWYMDDLSLVVPQMGSLFVIVGDDDGQPIEGARVELVGVDVSSTNEEGEVRFTNVPGGDYDLLVTSQGFTDYETQVEIIVNEEAVEEVFLERWDSFIEVDIEDIIFGDMEYGDIEEVTFNLTNIGQDATNYKIYINSFIGGNQRQDGVGGDGGGGGDDPWNLIERINLTELTGDQYFYGAQFIRDEPGDDSSPRNYRFIAAAGNFQTGECHFYTFDRTLDSELISVSLQNRGAYEGWGLRDLTYIPDIHRIIGSNGEFIRYIDPEDGDQVGGGFRQDQLQLNRAIAYDPEYGEDGALWVGNWDDTWFMIDIDSRSIVDRNSQHGLTGVTGMAWNPSDPDGFHLYIHNQESENGGAAIYRYNPETREIERILVTAEEDEGFAGGAFVTYLYDTHKYHLGVVIQGEDGDVLKIYELWDRSSWISIDPTAGEIAGGQEIPITVTLDSRAVYDEGREAIIEIYDTVLNIAETIFCEITVVGGLGSIIGTLTSEDAGDLSVAVISLNDGDRINPNVIDEEQRIYDFRYDDLIPGNYRVKVSNLEDYEEWESDLFVLEPEGEVALEIVLRPLMMGTVTGTVLSVDDDSVEGAEISAFTVDDERLIESTISDQDGSYDLLLPPGDYNLLVHHVDWGSERENGVEVVDEEVTVVDFVLNDRYQVKSLRTDGYYDDRIELTWAPPGTDGEEVEIAHHSGMLANGVYLINPNDQLAVKFTPEGVYDVVNISVYIIKRNGPLGGVDGWPDRRADNIYLYVYVEDPETGMPGELLKTILFDTADRNFEEEGWENQLVRDVRFLQGSFFIAWSQDPDDLGEDGVALDDDNDNEGTTFARFDNEWRQYDDFPGDMVIGAVIWSYFEAEEDGERLLVQPRQVRSVGIMPHNMEDLDDIVMMNPAFEPIVAPPLRLNWQDIYNLIAPPLRDELVSYQIYVDDEPQFDEELLAPDVRSWFHEIGSDHENEEYTYSIGALFIDPNNEENDEEIRGVSRDDMANMPPGLPSELSLEVDGFSYTITWEAPNRNQDRTDCIDNVGTEVFINGEFVGNSEGEEPSWSGEIDEGEEGWYDITLIAYDEVPNRSRPFTATIPIGEAEVYDFENNDPVVFDAEPIFGGWRRANHQGEVHNGRGNWETNDFENDYEDDADWTITTSFEFLVNSETASLEFYTYLETELGRDGGQVLISENGGDWSLITPQGGYPDQTVEAFRNEPGYTGNMTNWTLAQFDLSPYLGNVIRIRFRFGSDESLNDYDGWHIDDMVFWGCQIPDYATVFGIVTDQNGQPVDGITISDGRQDVISDNEGGYLLNNVLAGERVVTASEPGYNYLEHQLDIEEGEEIEHDFDIVRAAVAVDPDAYEFELGGNDQLSVELEISNLTEIDLPYWIRLSSTPEHLRDDNRVRNVRSVEGGNSERDDPWDIAFDLNMTDIIGHSRIMGAEFANDNFFITSADPVHGPMIHVLDWQGNLLNSFDQPIDVVGWGLRDLAFDGDLLYGSQGDVIYGFNLDGELVEEFAGAPITVNRAIAYDPVDDGFWVGEWDSPWYFVDREGQAEMIWDGHQLEGVYGFAYHQDDIDRLPLYVLNLNDEGNTDVYRANPGNEDIELVHEIVGAPTGCFITGSWDDNRWVLGAVSGMEPQQLYGLELGPRVSWINVDPVSGVIDAGGSEIITIDIIVPIDAEEDDVYEAELSVRVFDNSIASIPIQARITAGFQHFENPQESDNIHTIGIESATYQGNWLPIGSEIAVFTPRDEVGGVMRWLDHADEFSAYQGEGAFNRDERFDFRVWIPNLDRVYEPDVELLDGFDRFRNGETTTFALSIVAIDTQTVELADGWNLSSIYVRPQQFDVADILAGVNERGNLVIAKNGVGRFWWPEMNFNGLGEWEMLAAYQINVSEPETFTVFGGRVPPNTPINLEQGWNVISYLFDHEVDSRVALSDILDDIRIAKDGDGLFMVPDVDFFGLGPLIPGSGYKLKMHRNSELVYNDQEENIVENAVNPNVMPANNLPATGSDMSILIEKVSNIKLGKSTILNAYSVNSDVMIGSATIESLPAGMVIHGDDVTTEVIDGAVEGEPIRFELDTYSSNFQVEAKLLAGRLEYNTDALTRLEIHAIIEAVPESFTISNVFPNPFNDAAVIKFSVPSEMSINVVIRDITGREIYRQESFKYAAGWHEVSIVSTNWSSGIYFMDIQADNQIYQRKLVLLR